MSDKLQGNQGEILFKILFIAAIISLSIIIGGAGVYYKWPAFKVLTDSYKEGQQWHRDWKRAQRKPQATVVSEDIPDAPSSKQHKRVKGFKVLSGQQPGAQSGYTLFNMRSEELFLVDMEGRLVRHWKLPFRDAWPNPKHVSMKYVKNYIERAHLFPNGDLLVIYHGLKKTPYGYGLAKYDKDGNILWTFDDNVHHDFHISQDGCIYVLTQKTIRTPIKRLKNIHYPQLLSYVVKLSPDGREQKRVFLPQAFLDSDFDSLIKRRQKPHIGKKWDRLHTNSVMVLDAPMAQKFPMFKEGQVLLSIRNIHALAVLDMEEEKIVWAVRGPWLAQHAARFLSTGNIGVFDNRGIENFRQRVSRVLILDPATNEIVWRFRGNNKYVMDSITYGRIQELPNGNLLIVDSIAGKRIWEVTPDREVVWLYGRKRGSGKKHQILSAMRYRPEDLPFLQEGP